MRAAYSVRLAERQKQKFQAVVLQAMWRGCAARKMVKDHKSEKMRLWFGAAAHIQKWWRGIVAARKSRAATRIQCCWRAAWARTRCAPMKAEAQRAHACDVIQKAVRWLQARRVQAFGAAGVATLGGKRYAAATKIQAHWRAAGARARYRLRRAERRRDDACTLIQMAVRFMQARRVQTTGQAARRHRSSKLHRTMEVRHAAATRIQSAWRAAMARARYRPRKAELRREAACTLLQKALRMLQVPTPCPLWHRHRRGGRHLHLPPLAPSPSAGQSVSCCSHRIPSRNPSHHWAYAGQTSIIWLLRPLLLTPLLHPS